MLFWLSSVNESERLSTLFLQNLYMYFFIIYFNINICYLEKNLYLIVLSIPSESFGILIWINASWKGILRH